MSLYSLCTVWDIYYYYSYYYYYYYDHADIRELDGDSKTLVYENYGKFINATESIHHVSLFLSFCHLFTFSPSLSLSLYKLDFESNKGPFFTLFSRCQEGFQIWW